MTHPSTCLCPTCLTAVRRELRNLTQTRECENAPGGKHKRALVGPFCKYCGEKL